MLVPYYDVAASQASAAADVEAAVLRVTRSGWYILGPEVEAFEAEWAAACGVEHAVSVGNGFDALRLILQGLGIGPGDEVVVPAHTFVATWLAVSAVGAIPVGADVDRRTGLLDVDATAAAIGPRTAALLPVHLYGQPVDAEAFAALADRHGVALVEDAAQAHGASWRGRPAGSLGAAAGFSFYPGKNLGALGDGGAVTTSDGALAERIRRLANYGSSKRYVHDVQGTNSRLDELQAAVLRAKLPHLDAWTARRNAVASAYLAGLASVDDLELPWSQDGARHAWHIFAIRHADRDDLADRLASSGIGTSAHYPVPPHRSGAYGHGAAGRFPNAEDWADRCLSLPMGPAVGADAVDRVITAVRATVPAGSALTEAVPVQT